MRQDRLNIPQNDPKKWKCSNPRDRIDFPGGAKRRVCRRRAGKLIPERELENVSAGDGRLIAVLSSVRRFSAFRRWRHDVERDRVVDLVLLQLDEVQVIAVLARHGERLGVLVHLEVGRVENELGRLSADWNKILVTLSDHCVTSHSRFRYASRLQRVFRAATRDVPLELFPSQSPQLRSVIPLVEENADVPSQDRGSDRAEIRKSIKSCFRFKFASYTMMMKLTSW